MVCGSWTTIGSFQLLSFWLQIHPDHKGWSLSSSRPSQHKIHSSWSQTNTWDCGQLSWLGRDTEGTGKCPRWMPGALRLPHGAEFPKPSIHPIHAMYNSKIFRRSLDTLTTPWDLWSVSATTLAMGLMGQRKVLGRRPWAARAFLRTTGLKCTLVLVWNIRLHCWGPNYNGIQWLLHASTQPAVSEHVGLSKNRVPHSIQSLTHIFYYSVYPFLRHIHPFSGPRPFLASLFDLHLPPSKYQISCIKNPQKLWGPCQTPFFWVMVQSPVCLGADLRLARWALG